MEYNRNEGAGKKLLEGIILSFEILGIFVLLQLMVAVVGAFAAMAAYMVKTGAGPESASRVLPGLITSSRYMIILTVVATAASTICSAGCYWIVWGRRKTGEDRRYFRETVLRGKTVAMISIADIGLYYLAILIAGVVAAVSPQTMEEYNELMEMTLGGSVILAMVGAVLLAPVNEECILRGLILRNLLGHFSVPVAVALQAVMFGIFHGNWVQGLYAIPVGAALGYVAVKTRSILPCIYMHLFYNLFSFVIDFLPEICHTVGFALLAIVVSAALVWSMGRDEGKQSRNPH